MTTTSLGSVWITTILVLLITISNSHAEVAPMIAEQIDSSIRASTDDVSMPVRVTGDGPRLALVGGGLTGWKSWEPFVDRLESTRTVAVLQPLSVQYGLEDRPLPEGFGIATEVAALENALDEIGWQDPVDVVAWSYGALVTLQYALGRPDRIRTLTLIEPPALWVLDDRGKGDPDVEAVRSLDISGPITADDLEQFLYAADLAPAGEPRDLPQWDLWMEHRRSLRGVKLIFDVNDDPLRLAAFDRPVMLVTGESTASYYKRIQETLASRLPRTHSVELYGGHATHIVSMERFLTELNDFHAAEYAESKDGTPIGFVRKGSGPAVLFVHGTSADRKSWDRLREYLEDDLSLYAMDRRGRGLSGDATEYTFEREVEDVVAVTDAIAEPVILFGHSYGGLVALEAARTADNVSGLILYEPAIPNGVPAISSHDREKMQELIDRGELESAMEYFLRSVVLVSEEMLQAYRTSPLWKARIPHVATIPRELRAEETYVFDPSIFSDFEVPTTLIQGGDSPAIYREAVHAVRSALPHSELIVLDGQQHVAHHEDPASLARAILNSL